MVIKNKWSVVKKGSKGSRRGCSRNGAYRGKVKKDMDEG